MDITEVSIIHHVGIVLLLLWLLSSLNSCHPIAYFLSLIYLFMVHERYAMRLRRKIQFEERRQTYQKRVLSDSETVRWLNHAVEKIWPVCMENIVSQKILLPIIPWFLQKYKPWTVKDFVVQQLYLGRSPPMFTEMRVLRQSTDDDHLVLELGMNFRTADDMSAILDVKLSKRLGFGMWAKLHLMGMHVEGKVLVGVKFIRKWPYLGRLRVCFVEPPYFQMTVKPIIAHGLDVTELPGIAGWLDKLLDLAFEETLVEPNMLVVDVEKFASPQPDWFFVDAKDPIAYALVEVVEASDMKPSDLNGLADPYVKGQLGAYRFRTKTQKKTLSPKWQEEFRIPICSWESPNVLTIEIRDKDHFVDDTLGDCSINISNLRDGQRHDMWLPLRNIKMGRLHLAICVLEGNEKGAEQALDEETLSKRNSSASDTAKKGSSSGQTSENSPKMADKLEPIDIEGQREPGIWVLQPGTEVLQKWEPRKGRNRLADSRIQEGGDSMGSVKSSGSASCQNDTSSPDESLEDSKKNPKGRFQRGLHKIGSVFHRNPKGENDKAISFEEPIPSPHPNLRAVNAKESGVTFVVEDSLSSPPIKAPKVEGRESPKGSEPESPNKINVKDMKKSILKHAGNSARGIKHALSRKGSRKFKSETESVMSVGSDSSIEESLPSPVNIPPIEASSVGSALNSDSFKSEDVLVQTNINDAAMGLVEPISEVCVVQGSERPAMNIEDPMDKVGVDGFEKTAHDPPGSSEENTNRLVECSNPKLSD